MQILFPALLKHANEKRWVQVDNLRPLTKLDLQRSHTNFVSKARMNRVVLHQTHFNCWLEHITRRRRSIMKSLEQLSIEAVPDPGTVAGELFLPRHPVRYSLERREYREMREKYQKIHQVKFRYALRELKLLYEWNWTWTFFPSHIPFIKRFSLLKL